jgi:DME family drug/metabolite transporter
MAVAGPLLGAGSLARGHSLRPRSWHFLPAGLGMAAYQGLYFSAVPRAGVAATALLAICSAPVLVTVLAWAFLDERPDRLGLAALAVGVAGAALLVGGARGAAPDFLAGALLALGAGLTWSVYLVIMRRAAPIWPGHGLVALTFLTAALVLAPLLVMQAPAGAHLWARAWPFLLYLGAVPTALAYGIWTVGIRRLAAGPAAVVGLLEPLTASLLGVVLFGERLQPAGWAGAALLLCALAALGRRRGGVSLQA